MKRPSFFFEGEGTGGGGAAPAAPATLVTEPAGGTPPAVTAPAAAPAWVTDDGTLGDGWLNKLPEEIRANPSLKVMGSLADLAKSYVSTKALVGKKLEMPGEGATPEALTEWRKIHGAPEKPEGYIPEGSKSIRPDTIPEGMWDAKAEQEFLSIAHKHSLPPSAVKDIMAYYGQHMAGAITASAEAEIGNLKAEGDKLKADWGKDYDSNLALASRVAQTVGLDPKTHSFFTSAEGVKAFAKMGKLLSEDKLISGHTGSNMAATLASRIAEIQDAKSTSVLALDYRGINGPDRQAAAQQQLHELMTASKQK